MKKTEHPPALAWSLLMAAALCCSTSRPAVAEGELVLVKDGVSRAPIVIPKDAPPFTRRAADELAGYIEKISGAKPAVVEGEPDPIPEHAIWVGHQPALKPLFPSTDFDFKHPEEILVAASADHLVIAGRDRWEPGKMFMQRDGMDVVVKGAQAEYGTVNAVYTFLQDYLQVRWLWPGELGEDIQPRKTIAFEPFEYRYHPQIRSRRGLFARTRLTRIGFRTDSADQNWVRFQRLLFDSLAAPGGHAFSGWWDRFHEKHAEYFALQPDGTRSLYTSPKHAKLCHANPAVSEEWLRDVERQLERNPNLTVFNASPNDGFNSGHCVCKECRAWDHPGGEKLRFYWEGVTRDDVALTDRHITFANLVARKLKEEYPGKDYYVSMTAYGNWRPVPVEARPAKNVIISVVTNFHNKKFAGRTELAQGARERFRAWGKVAPHLVWRPNLGFAMWQGGLPKVDMDAAVQDMRLVAENHVIGVFFDKLWQNWATQGPHYYMLAQMAWNPYADGPAILEDYYRRGFGKASGHVKAYWGLMQETTRAILAARETVRYDPPWWDFYNDSFFEAGQGHLNAALEAMADEPEVYRERIGFLQTGLDYVRAITDARSAMMRYRGSDGEDAGAEAQARSIWVKRIRPLVVNEKYPSAFNAMYIRPGGGRALRKLCPADLTAAWPLDRWLDSSQ